MPLDFKYGDKTVQEFVHLYEAGQLNLEPGFQRDSVWAVSDRKRFLESIINAHPVPSVFLYERSDSRGRLIYDVIDGKQRLESILMYLALRGYRGSRFSVRMSLDSQDEVADWNWPRLKRRRQSSRLMKYQIQTVEVEGDLGDIIDLFVRINSTGKRLTGAEKRNAKYYHTDFLRRAERLARHRRRYFLEHRILSQGQVQRMKHIELVCELLASILADGPINKKNSLDEIIGGLRADGRSLPRSIQECVANLNRLERMFPKLRTTRFANAVDFYSLFLLVRDMEKEGMILNNPQRNRQAQKLLIWLSNGVDVVQEQIRKGEGARQEQGLFKDYLLTVRADTDSRAQRQRRAAILRSVFGGLFEKKDERRTFTREQRRLIWHSDERKKCLNCRDLLTWNNFTIDHVKPHSLGGRTSIANAALMCRTCNSRKGARQLRTRKKSGTRR